MPTFTGHERYFQGRETIDLIRKTSTSADDTADSVANALRQDVMTRDASGIMIVSAQESRWFLPVANITNDPRPGDVIKRSVANGSTRYVIQTAERIDMIASWDCFVTKER